MNFSAALRILSGEIGAAPVTRQPELTREQKRDRWPEFRPGNPEEIAQLSKARCVSIEGIRFAQDAGTLFFGFYRDESAWFVADRFRIASQARRLDGKPWKGCGPKALTLPGSIVGDPLGWSLFEGLQNSFPILVVEGGTDMLAAYSFMSTQRKYCFDVWTFLGSSTGSNISADCLKAAKGRHVRIFADADQAGQKAARKWSEQFSRVASLVDVYDFSGLFRRDGKPVGDLNDCSVIREDQKFELEDLLP